MRPVLAGKWFAFHWHAVQGGSDNDYEGAALAGYDATLNQFVEHDAGSDSSYGSAVAAGWSGDSLVWDGNVNNWEGKTVKIRKTYTKISDSSFSVSIDVSADGQTWTQAHEITFAR